MQSFQLSRKADSGSVWRHCSMRCKKESLARLVSFNAAISACEQASQQPRISACNRWAAAASSAIARAQWTPSPD
eukprot:1088460-Karenia_brevis.AAC.1